MAKESYLRGHHLSLFQIYLKGTNTDFKQVNFFNGIISYRDNKIILVDFNDEICRRCDYEKEDYCMSKGKRMNKEDVAKADIHFATEVFEMPMKEPLPVLYVIEKIIPPAFLTGNSPEDLLRNLPRQYAKYLK